MKPEFWTDEKIIQVSRDARLFFIGMLNWADDNGVLENKPLQLKARIFPCDDVDVAKLITELVAVGIVAQYNTNGEDYLWIKKFNNHQVIDRPRKTNLPICDFKVNQLKSNEIMLGREGKGREGKGMERKQESTPTAQVKSEKLKAKLESKISELKSTWEKNLSLYQVKYPGLDHELELQKMECWMQDNPGKALKRSSLNMFCHSWLGRARPNFNRGISKGIPVQLIIDPKWDREHYYDNYLTVSSDGRAKIEEMVALYEANDNKLGSKDRATLKEWKRDLEESK